MDSEASSREYVQQIERKALRTMFVHDLMDQDCACLLMVSGGSDSTALAHIMKDLQAKGHIGSLAMLHVDHQIRGQEAKEDAAFARQLAESLDIPFFLCEVDVPLLAEKTSENLEAVARRERYLAANDALSSMCQHEGYPISSGRIVVAHTLDDRIENFYMRSIVGTGPGGFRGMLYKNGPVVRPLLDCTRQELRDCIREIANVEQSGEGISQSGGEQLVLWREDATNAHTDRFRAYVRNNLVPPAKEWNERMPENLLRSMNLIADEDDMIESWVDCLAEETVRTLCDLDQGDTEGESGQSASRTSNAPLKGYLLLPSFGNAQRPLQRRAVHRLLKHMLGGDTRIDSATVETILDGFSAQGTPKSGYVSNIQGNLAVSANKQGVRIEPMSEFRARRKRR